MVRVVADGLRVRYDEVSLLQVVGGGVTSFLVLVYLRVGDIGRCVHRHFDVNFLSDQQVNFGIPAVVPLARHRPFGIATSMIVSH